MSYTVDRYKVFFKDTPVGEYRVTSDGNAVYQAGYDLSEEISAALGMQNLLEYNEHAETHPVFAAIFGTEERLPPGQPAVYHAGDFTLIRMPDPACARFSVYRRAAKEGEPDYSPLPHDAPHYEGAKTPEGMREWASWYAFNKMNDGSYEAELDEAWCWGGGHNDGGTRHVAIPQEYFALPYEAFLNEIIPFAGARHYGFTAEMLLQKPGLREFFGLPADGDAKARS